MLSKAPHASSMVTTDARIVEAWRHGVLSSAKFPRPRTGEKNKTLGMSDDEKLRWLIDLEKPALKELWSSFNDERGGIARYLSDPKHAAVVYALGFHLPNVARCKLALRRAFSREEWRHTLQKNFDAIQMVDFGCGSGALSHAIWDFFRTLKFSPQSVDVNLIDSRQAFLNMAGEILSADSINSDDRLHKYKIQLSDFRVGALTEKLPTGTDPKKVMRILAFGYVLNEQLRNARSKQYILKTCEKALDSESPSMIVVSDSANQNIARQMMEFRDDLVRVGYNAIYPCPNLLTCPMLEKNRDWCYSEGVWKQPSMQTRVDRIMGIRRSRFASSLYIFVKPGIFPGSDQVSSHRVVGVPRDKDRENIAHHLICGPEGLSKSGKHRATLDRQARLFLRGEEYVERRGEPTK